MPILFCLKPIFARGALAPPDDTCTALRLVQCGEQSPILRRLLRAKNALATLAQHASAGVT